MKKYIKSSTYYPDTVRIMLEQVPPYDIKCVGQLRNGNYLFEGHPDPYTETIPELINLVEMISKRYSIPIEESHVVNGPDGRFITFQIPY